MRTLFQDMRESNHMQKQLDDILAGLDGIRKQADQAFAGIAEAHPGQVTCKKGCDDCCHAVFDLSPVEALGIALAFAELPRNQRRETLRRADKAAGEFDKVLKEALALPEAERLGAFSRARIACPLLQKGGCLLYGQRPVTCRLYGVPVASAGEARTCHKAGFKQGGTYTTVNLDAVNQVLDQLSADLLKIRPQTPKQRMDLARVLLNPTAVIGK